MLLCKVKIMYVLFHTSVVKCIEHCLWSQCCIKNVLHHLNYKNSFTESPNIKSKVQTNPQDDKI